jgi:hypothetical protein
MSVSSEDLEKALERLEAERHGRGFPAAEDAGMATTIGRWLAWLTPEIRAAMTARGEVEDTKPTHTTTYSRVAVPKEIEQPHDEPKPTEWTPIFVTTERPSDTSPGAIEGSAVRHQWRPDHSPRHGRLGDGPVAT